MEELMKEEKEGVKAAEQEKPKKRRNRKKNRKNEMKEELLCGHDFDAGDCNDRACRNNVSLAGKQCGPPRRLLVVAEDGGDQSDDQPALRGRCG